MKPNHRTRFYNFEDALFRVPYFAKVLEVGAVPITLEDDGTFQYFGCGRKVYFNNGKPDGPWVRSHENGQLAFKGTYKNGEMEGPWVWYDEGGQVNFEVTYKDGKKVECSPSATMFQRIEQTPNIAFH